jgi:hypothetical protein
MIEAARQVELDKVREVGRCRLTVSKPALKALAVSVLETRISITAFNGCCHIRLALLKRGGYPWVG